ncbi:hypothetical protein BLNAU_1724 [Blattamonas nauphoetae]|uniref:RING-CH-type domain-containing protein n=1 Tax=Blattamonas nauphoetae TaxID=2049346 RepID=A0ABQ9YHF5_9EUKA|nr:hypothetical protein BLNAU_1724 [Blattamonas nauphoetae]
MSNNRICYICQLSDTNEQIIRPCHCTGELGYVHPDCITEWIKSQLNNGIEEPKCQFCQHIFLYKTKPKPFKQWKRMPIDMITALKIVFSTVAFFLTLYAASFAIPDMIYRQYKFKQATVRSYCQYILYGLAELFVVFLFLTAIQTYINLIRKWRRSNQAITIVLPNQFSDDGYQLGGSIKSNRRSPSPDRTAINEDHPETEPLLASYT